MMQAKELRGKDEKELREQLQELSRELYKIQTELKISRKFDKPHLFREKRRDRARLMTVLKEKSSVGKAS